MWSIDEKLVVSVFGFEINLVTRGQIEDFNYHKIKKNCFAASRGSADNLEEVLTITSHC